ncbi:MAG TPA: hypothetical protein VFH66_05465 [Mycobacteriales bacterium]|nr:hypothetical protein [Mycobacteriales bacterium]
MPKVSKATASSHQVFPGYVENYEEAIGDWTVSIEKNFVDMDEAPFFKGAPDDRCQATHLGYVLKGKFGVRRADGVEEVFEAGDAFVIEPGHTPLAFAGGEYLAFTPTKDAREQTAVVMPNIIRFAEEHGVALTAQLTPTA